VAENKRRGENVDDEFVVDDDALADDADLDLADDDDESDAASVPAARRNASTATKAATRARQAKAAKIAKGDVAPSGNRITRFVREVVAELRKVNWPSRKELLTYTVVVLVFVIVMMSIVGALDYGFGWLVSHTFA
jgi:preprotein translocase subunit SecE